MEEGHRYQHLYYSLAVCLLIPAIYQMQKTMSASQSSPSSVNADENLNRKSFDQLSWIDTITLDGLSRHSTFNSEVSRETFMSHIQWQKKTSFFWSL
jgi:hypothetical protein